MSLVLSEVRKSFTEPGGRKLPVLDIRRFAMQDGEQVALVGSSGGGKTTLLNVIAGITLPDQGSVVVDNTDISRLRESVRDLFRARKIGFVFQTFNLLPAFSALENILLGMKFSGRGTNREFARHLLDRVGLGGRLHHKPAQLSVGEQQRVAVARSLANQPTLLLADEPTASVDSTNQQGILSLLRETCREQKCALLLVTHSPEISAQFERVEQIADLNRP